jgi:hypothetical protein
MKHTETVEEKQAARIVASGALLGRVPERLESQFHHMAWHAADGIVNEDTSLHSAGLSEYEAIENRIVDLMATAFELGYAQALLSLPNARGETREGMARDVRKHGA